MKNYKTYFVMPCLLLTSFRVCAEQNLQKDTSMEALELT